MRVRVPVCGWVDVDGFGWMSENGDGCGKVGRWMCMWVDGCVGGWMSGNGDGCGKVG